MLTEVGQAITTIPDGFDAHRQIKKVYSQRADMVSGMESLVDWAMAEALAFGTLVAEGNHVRLSGQVRPPQTTPERGGTAPGCLEPLGADASTTFHANNSRLCVRIAGKALFGFR